ncbi:MAG: hypothetical protein LC687_05015 [Actinobacteria bacterium]|nr:hypothetical protein [Actinomycetota bacterium]MCA1807195.1 hypothetical protein [Actinomycetota bacterium]
MEVQLPYWLTQDLVIRGAEDESSGSDESGEGAGSDDGGDDGNQGSDGSSEGEESSSDSSGDNLEGLKAALRRERQINRENTKKLTKLERESTRRSQTEQSELERTKEELSASSTRAKTLAEGFLKVKLDRAIEKAAAKARFRDTDDALAMVDRSAIVVDQDEENPADIELDTKSVEDAVKKLASSKRHLISSGTEDDAATGGQFGGKNKQKKLTTEEEYQKKYPSL